MSNNETKLTPRAKQALTVASQVAVEFNCEYTGTEHVLLGLLSSDTVAARVLKKFKVNYSRVYKAVQKELREEKA